MLLGLAQVDLKLHFDHSNLLAGLPLLLLPLLPPASVTCSFGACQAYTLAVHSSSADDAVHFADHLGHSLEMGVLAMFVGNASVVVLEMLLTDCPRRGLARHHSFAGVPARAHDGVAGIARNRSWWVCLEVQAIWKRGDKLDVRDLRATLGRVFLRARH